MAMTQPVRASWVPQMVGQTHLMNALSLNSIAMNGSRLVGSALIGVLIAMSGAGIAYVISVGLSGLLILTTLLIRPPQRQAVRLRHSMKAQLLAGFRFMLQDRLVLLLILIGLGPLAFAFSYMTLLPVIATDVLGMGPEGFGALLSVGAVGALIGGVILASSGDMAHKGRVMVGAGLGYGVVLILLGGIPLALLAFPIIALAGACQTVFRTANNTSLLLVTPPDLQGRVFSMTLLYTAMVPLASVLAGVITDASNVPTAMVVIGSVCLAVVACVALLEPRIRRL